MLNKCTFIGNLGRDPEIKEQQTMIANFSLAVTERRKDKSDQYVKETQWINCVAFGRLADVIGQHTFKGSKIYVETKFKLDKYTNKNGEEKQTPKFIVTSVVLLGDKPQGNNAQAPLQSFDDDIPF